MYSESQNFDYSWVILRRIFFKLRANIFYLFLKFVSVDERERNRDDRDRDR